MISSSGELGEHLTETADNLAGLMGVRPKFVDQWAPRTMIFPAQIRDLKPGSGDRRIASISMKNGIPVDENDNPTTGYAMGDIEALLAYDERLVPSGLGCFATYESRHRSYSSSVESSRYLPLEPERAALTVGFMQSIGALKRLGGAEVDFSRRDRRTITSRAQGLTRTLLAVVVEALFLPPNPPTWGQSVAMEKLRTSVRIPRTLRKKTELITAQSTEYAHGDIKSWETELRKTRLRWLTSEELA